MAGLAVSYSLVCHLCIHSLHLHTETTFERKGLIPVFGNLFGAGDMHYVLKKWKREFQIPDKLYNRMLRNIAVPVAAASVPILGSILCAVCVFLLLTAFSTLAIPDHILQESPHRLIYLFYAIIIATGIQTSDP